MSRRITIFGINYWPEEIGVAPYTTGLAEYLASQGWAVHVVTGLPHYPNWRVAPRYGNRSVTEHCRGVTVKRLWHYVPKDQTAARRGGYEATFCLHALAQLRLERPDIVLGIVPSLGGGVDAVLAAKRWRVPSVVLFQDMMSNAAQQSGISGGGKVARLTGRVEGWMARSADGVATVCDAFEPTLRDFGVSAEKIVHLRNWSRIPGPKRSRDEVRGQLGWSDDTFVALHAGNMGLKQALGNVVETAKLAERHAPHLRFVLMGNGSQRRQLELQARGLGNLSFLEPQPIEELPDVLAAADALLVNERGSVKDMSLPSKLTSYFVAGRPVVAAISEGATAAEIRRAGAGLVAPAEHPAKLLATIEHLASDKALAERLGAAGAKYAATVLNQNVILPQAEAFLADLIDRRAAARLQGAGAIR